MQGWWLLPGAIRSRLCQSIRAAGDLRDPSWSGDGQRFVRNEMMLGVGRSYCFDGLCCGLHFVFSLLYVDFL